MKTQSTDTSPEAERVQIALLRKAPFAQRMQMTLALSEWIIQLSWRGLKRRHPDASVLDIRLRSLAYNYGQPLAHEITTYLQGREIVSIPPTLMAGIAPVVQLLEDLHIPYYIGGSVASSLYGIPRATLDVDLVADLRSGQVHEFVQRLQDDYYVSEDAIREAIQHQTSFNVIYLATMLKIDVFVKKTRLYEQELFQRLRQLAPDDEGVGPALSWLAPEDSVLTKLEWYRMGGETSERQWSDILGVLKVQGETLDRPYLRRWAAQLAVADLLERAFVDAGLADDATS